MGLDPPGFIYNEEITLYSLNLIIEVEFQGLRCLRNRSILSVCEDFENKHNEEITLYN